MHPQIVLYFCTTSMLWQPRYFLTGIVLPRSNGYVYFVGQILANVQILALVDRQISKKKINLRVFLSGGGGGGGGGGGWGGGVGLKPFIHEIWFQVELLAYEWKLFEKGRFTFERIYLLSYCRFFLTKER